jgi:hypothetical protein
MIWEVVRIFVPRSDRKMRNHRSGDVQPESCAALRRAVGIGLIRSFGVRLGRSLAGFRGSFRGSPHATHGILASLIRHAASAAEREKDGANERGDFHNRLLAHSSFCACLFWRSFPREHEQWTRSRTT